MVHVARILVYPIKSCRGIEVEASELTVRGLAYDRRFMLIDSNGRFLTQRRHPKMALLETSIEGNELVVSAPARPSLRLPLELTSPGCATCTVRVWNDTVEANLAGADANIWFSEFMGFACGLVYLADHQHRAIPNAVANFDDEVSFADGAPLLLVSEASLDELNRRLQVPVSIERFRPNLVVTADAPHAEDQWRSITTGDVRLDVAWPCSRCVLVTVDPRTGRKDPDGEPLETLRSYRRRDRAVYFGQNLIPRSLGRIVRGAECAIDGIIAA